MAGCVLLITVIASTILQWYLILKGGEFDEIHTAESLNSDCCKLFSNIFFLSKNERKDWDYLKHVTI